MCRRWRDMVAHEWPVGELQIQLHGCHAHVCQRTIMGATEMLPVSFDLRFTWACF